MTDTREEPHVGGVSRISQVVVIGCLWAAIETSAGVALRGGCAYQYSGSILTGSSLLFFGAAFALAGRSMLLLLLPLLAGLSRAYSGLLAGQALAGGAVANPVYAYLMETLAFYLVISVAHNAALRSRAWAAGAGVGSAALAALLFLPVGVFTGAPACVVEGTTTPLALWGMPVAATLGAAALPLGIELGRVTERHVDAWRARGGLLLRACAAAITGACLLVVTLSSLS